MVVEEVAWRKMSAIAQVDILGCNANNLHVLERHSTARWFALMVLGNVLVQTNVIVQVVTLGHDVKLIIVLGSCLTVRKYATGMVIAQV